MGGAGGRALVSWHTTITVTWLLHSLSDAASSRNLLAAVAPRDGRSRRGGPLVLGGAADPARRRVLGRPHRGVGRRVGSVVRGGVGRPGVVAAVQADVRPAGP